VAFAPSKHLRLPDPGLRHELRETELGYEIAVTAERLARFVWLELEGSDAVFSDNFFDLPAGREVTVDLPTRVGASAEALNQVLRVRSLFDSF
jgi:beta-mannosidase